MGNWRNRILLLLILATTAFSVITVWPSNPDRYLPDAIPWPEGRGIKITLPTLDGNTFGTTTLERRSMSLGLDLRGGTRLVLAPVPSAQVIDLEDALQDALAIIERRVNEFGVAESEVNLLGKDKIAVQLPGISPEEAFDKIGRTASLQFCVPVQDENGDVAVVSRVVDDDGIVQQTGVAQYREQTCEPLRDADGNIIVENGVAEFVPWASQNSADSLNNPDRDLIIWEPAAACIDEEPTDDCEKQLLTGQLLRSNTSVTTASGVGNLLGDPILLFEWTSTGADISAAVTAPLAERGLPLATFLDGSPIIGEDGGILAPTVQSTISDRGTITGLSERDAEDLSTLLNIGAFPVPLEVIQQQSVDATLGETAVRNSVVAGIVGLLLIMLFMIVYYRLPGLTAAAALVVYTSVVLALFKLIPVTLTLAGVAAFILSVGMAIDANILIFERMKEELRVGRNIRVALEDGFNRAWSSIRDSNISTLITCGILYYFGNQFNESSIKGFAITLAIGVIVSMFSAIFVTKTFMRLLVSSRFFASRVWLFAPDIKDTSPRPAVAGGSGTGKEER